jgi:hypothetical protein
VATAFSYPDEDELQSWAQDVGIDLDAGAARRERWRLRVAVQLFTKSIVVVVAVSVMLAVAATQVTGTNFWVLYGAAVAVPLLSLVWFRPAVAALWPRLAVQYYLAAVMDRLRHWSIDPGGGAEYLRKVVPPLEMTLLGPKLLARLAGSHGARAELRPRLAAVARRLGEAEVALQRQPSASMQTQADRLRAVLGQALIAIQRGQTSGLPETSPEAPIGSVSPIPDPPTSWGGKFLETARDKAFEAIILGFWTALVAVFAPILRQ